MNQDPDFSHVESNAVERRAYPELPEYIDGGAAYEWYVGVGQVIRDLNRQAQEKRMSPISSDKGQVPDIARKAQLLGGTSTRLLLVALENWPVLNEDNDY